MKKEIINASHTWASLLFCEGLWDKSAIVSCCLLSPPPTLVSAREHGSVAGVDEGLLVPFPRVIRPS